MWETLSIQKDNAQDSPETLKTGHSDAAPPKRALDPVNGNKHSTPVQQNGFLDQGEDYGVTTSIDENQLTWILLAATFWRTDTRSNVHIGVEPSLCYGDSMYGHSSLARQSTHKRHMRFHSEHPEYCRQRF